MRVSRDLLKNRLITTFVRNNMTIFFLSMDDLNKAVLVNLGLPTVKMPQTVCYSNIKLHFIFLGKVAVMIAVLGSGY